MYLLLLLVAIKLVVSDAVDTGALFQLLMSL